MSGGVLEDFGIYFFWLARFFTLCRISALCFAAPDLCAPVLYDLMRAFVFTFLESSVRSFLAPLNLMPVVIA